MMSHIDILKKHANLQSSKFNTNFNVFYNFAFVSLVPPFFMGSDAAASHLPEKTTRRSFVKKSYLLFTWLHYLSHVELVNESRALRVATLPVKRSMYTLQRAPMAHKTNSKEQFVFKFYRSKISFAAKFLPKYSLRSLNQGLLAMLLTRRMFPVFETNLLFLRYYRVTCFVSDSIFFSTFRSLR